MGDSGYLLARLPAMDAASPTLPIDPETFCDLVLEPQARYWVVAILDWLRLANAYSESHHLPLPYPDAAARPRLAWPADGAWGAWYERLGALTAPALVRTFVRADAATLARRAAALGRPAPIRLPPGAEMGAGDGGAGPDADVPAATRRDAQRLAHGFRRLDAALAQCQPRSPAHVQAYALKLLSLARAGRRPR